MRGLFAFAAVVCAFRDSYYGTTEIAPDGFAELSDITE